MIYRCRRCATYKTKHQQEALAHARGVHGDEERWWEVLFEQ